MIRLFHVYFPSRILFLAVSESLLILLALLIATILWAGGDAESALSYKGDTIRMSVATIVLVLCLHYFDLYDSLSLHKRIEAFARLVQGLGVTSIILACLYYAYPPVLPGLGSFVVWIVLAGLISLTWRRLFLTVSALSQLTQRTILVGSGPIALPLLSELEARPEFGMSVVGYIEATAGLRPGINGLPCLGRLEELADVIKREHIRWVIPTISSGHSQLPALKGIAIRDGAEVYEAITGKVSLESLHQVGSVQGNWRIAKLILFYKRTASFILSLLGLILAAPVMLIVAIAIRLDSQGPAIFRQPRVGKDGNLFTIYKFRSMRVDADAGGPPRPAMQFDGRTTRVGRWLRRLRIDELPQLINILRGDMDLIGPRPFTPHEEAELEKQIPCYSQRWIVKPGATGWAQINRGYCTSIEDNADKLSYDLFYIKNMSIGLDCLILFQSLKILLLRRGGR